MIANLVNQLQTVVNEGANNLNVYPLNGMTFVGLSQNAPYSIAPGKAVGIVASSLTQAYIVFGTPSAVG